MRKKRERCAKREKREGYNVKKINEKLVLKQESLKVLTQYDALNDDDFMATDFPPACGTCSRPPLRDNQN
jgi:hypothetical protein